MSVTYTAKALLTRILSETRALLQAALISDVDEIGRQLEKREESLQLVKSNFGDNFKVPPELSPLYAELIDTDRQASLKIRELTRQYGSDALDYQKKTTGLLRYSGEKYNMASGRLLDKKD